MVLLCLYGALTKLTAVPAADCRLGADSGRSEGISVNIKESLTVVKAGLLEDRELRTWANAEKKKGENGKRRKGRTLVSRARWAGGPGGPVGLKRDSGLHPLIQGPEV